MKGRNSKLARTAAKTAETIAQARSTAVVREHGTEREQGSLMLSGLRASGLTLTTLAAAHEANKGIEIAPDPECLAQLTRRIERRTRLRLPAAECAADPPTPYCDCLERALDQPGDEGKRAILKLARAFHRRKTVEPPPKPPDPAPEAAVAEPPPPEPNPEPDPKPEPKTEPPVRVVHRTRRWFDGETKSFRDMTF
jgi:hypothetical protein